MQKSLCGKCTIDLGIVLVLNKNNSAKSSPNKIIENKKVIAFNRNFQYISKAEADTAIGLLTFNWQ